MRSSMQPTLLWVVIAVSLVILIGRALPHWAPGLVAQPVTVATAATRTYTLAYAYPTSAVDDYVSTCAAGADRNLCVCLIDKIQALYSYQQFLAVGPNDEVTKATPTLAAACRAGN